MYYKYISSNQSNDTNEIGGGLPSTSTIVHELSVLVCSSPNIPSSCTDINYSDCLSVKRIIYSKASDFSGSLR